MQAGSLRRRVSIQRPIQKQDTVTGSVTTSWQTVWGNVPCSIEALTGREFFAAQQVQSDVSTKVTYRWRPGHIDQTYRLVETTSQGTIYYNIEGILPDDTGRRTIQLLCKTRLSDGFRSENDA